MRIPETKLGLWRIRYAQKAYDNRYFQVYYDNKFIMEFVHVRRADWEKFLPCGFVEERNANLKSINNWERFVARVERYDRFLDSFE